jgi:hypothetical protein
VEERDGVGKQRPASGMLNRGAYPTYRVPRVLGYFWLAILSLLSGLGSVLGVVAALQGGNAAPSALGVVVWIFTVTYLWYVTGVLISYEVTIQNGTLECRGMFRRKSVAVDAVTSIKSAVFGLDPYTVVIRTTMGRVFVLRQMHHFHEMLTRLKQLNPEIAIEV